MAANETLLSISNTSDYIIYRDVVNFVYFMVLLPLGFFGNLFTVIIVSYIVRHRQTRRSIPDVCLGLLASVDLFSVLFIHSISAAAESKNQIILPLGLCEYQAFAVSLYLKLQFLLQILVCLDRHFALVRPLQYHKFSSLKTMKFLILLIVLVSICSTALTYATSFRDVEVLRTWTLCRFSWDFDGLAEYFVVGATMLVICVGLIAFIACNMTLVIVLWHYHKQKTELVWKEISKAVSDLKEGKKNMKYWNVENKNMPLSEVKQHRNMKTQLSNNTANHNSHLEGQELNIKSTLECNNMQEDPLSQCINQVHTTNNKLNKTNGFKMSDDVQVKVNGNPSIVNRNPELVNNNPNLDKLSSESIEPPIISTKESKRLGTVHNPTDSMSLNDCHARLSSSSPNANNCEYNGLLEKGESLFNDDSVFPSVSIVTSPNESIKGTGNGENSFLSCANAEKAKQLQLSEKRQFTSQQQRCDMIGPGNGIEMGSLPKETRTPIQCNGASCLLQAYNKNDLKDPEKCGGGKVMNDVESDMCDSKLQLGAKVYNESPSPETSSNCCVKNCRVKGCKCISEAKTRDKYRYNGETRNWDQSQIRSVITVHQENIMNNAENGQKELIKISHKTESTKPSLHLQVSLPISRHSSPQSPMIASGRMCSTTPEIVIDPPSGGSIDTNLEINSTTFHQHTLTSVQSDKLYVRHKSNESSSLDHFQSQVKKILRKIHKTAYKQQGEIFLARIVLLCAALFLLSWLPYAVVNGLYMLHHNVDPILEDVATRCIFANAVFNPIFYGICRKNYRKGYDYITQAFCHIATFGCIKAPGDDKVFFESRKQKQKRHLEAMEYMKQERKPRKSSAVPAMQILQQTLLLRSRSLRPSDTANFSSPHSPARSAPPDFHPSKHLQELFQRYMDESESDESEDESSPIDYEALECDDDQMYQNLKKVLSVYMGLDEISDPESQIDYNTYLDDFDRTESRRLLSLSDTNTVKSETAVEDNLQLNRYCQHKLQPHDFIRQHSCPGVRTESDETFL